MSAANIPVPLTALAQLFDMGNYGGCADQVLEPLDLARNALQHAAIELKFIGDVVGSPNPTLLDPEICSHCWRVAAQLEAALELVDALEEHDAPAVRSESEAAS